MDPKLALFANYPATGDHSAATLLESAVSRGVVGLFVPSTFGDDIISQADFEARIDSASRLLSRLFGGCTVVFPGRGYWPDGRHMIAERTFLAVSFVGSVDDHTWLQFVKACKSLKVVWRQSVIMAIGPYGVIKV